MAVAAKSRSSLQIEKCDFNKLVLNKYFIWLFSVAYKPSPQCEIDIRKAYY